MDAEHGAVIERLRAGGALVLLLLALLLAVGSPAQAAPTLGEGLIVVPQPAAATGLSYFRLAGRRGERIDAGRLMLINRSSRPMPVSVVAVPGQTLSTLGSSYGRTGEARRGSAAWLSLGAKHLVIPAGGQRLVSVTVQIPRHATAGDQLSGISVQPTHAAASQSRLSSAVSAASALRYVIGVETTIPGRRHALIRFHGASLRSDPGFLTFLLHARNEGDVLLQGVHGGVRISSGGHVLVSRALPAGTFVDGTSIAYPVPLRGHRPAAGTHFQLTAWLRYGRVTAHLRTTLTYGRHDVQLERRYAPPVGPTKVPWLTLLLCVALLYAVVATIALLRRRPRIEAGRH